MVALETFYFLQNAVQCDTIRQIKQTTSSQTLGTLCGLKV